MDNHEHSRITFRTVQLALTPIPTLIRRCSEDLARECLVALEESGVACPASFADPAERYTHRRQCGFRETRCANEGMWMHGVTCESVWVSVCACLCTHYTRWYPTHVVCVGPGLHAYMLPLSCANILAAMCGGVWITVLHVSANCYAYTACVSEAVRVIRLFVVSPRQAAGSACPS